MSAARQTEARRLFDELNRRYWRGRLPRYRVLRRRVLRHGALGWCADPRRTILLRSDLTGEVLRQTLLHEMCHIGGTTRPGWAHGAQFRRKVRRLVQLGESRLLEDIEAYDGTQVRRAVAAMKAKGRTVPSVPWTRELRSDLEALALDGCRRRWATLAPGLAERYHMTPAQLRRAAPWAEREWRALVAERRAEERARQLFKAGRLRELVS